MSTETSKFMSIDFFKKLSLAPNDQQISRFNIAKNREGTLWTTYDKNAYFIWASGTLKSLIKDGLTSLNDAWENLLSYLEGGFFEDTNDLIFKGVIYRIARDNYEREIDSLVYKPKKGEGIYECKRCKSSKIDSIPVQLRSGDEPSTILAKCEDCGFKWRDS